MTDHEEAINIGRNAQRIITLLVRQENYVDEYFRDNGGGLSDLYDDNATKCIAAHNI